MAIIINTSKIAKQPTTAYTRNALAMAKDLGLPIISTWEETNSLDANDFNTFIVSGSAFYPETARIEKWIRTNKNAIIIWVNNEYSTTPNSEYYRLMKDNYSVIISNVGADAVKCKGYNEFHLLNLNLLLYDTPNPIISKKYDCLYFGTYRPDRRLYFQEYFQENLLYVSSSKKNLKQYSQLAGADAIWCNKLNWEKGKETLNNFRYSLYIEDEYTHTHFNHLANRFYECLMCNVVQFFDKNCLATIRQSNLIIDEFFIVDGFKDLKEKLRMVNYKNAIKQQAKWNNQAAKQRVNLIEQLRKICIR